LTSSQPASNPFHICFADGQPQVVIAIQGTPFASMGEVAKGTVDVAAATKEAANWTADLQEVSPQQLHTCRLA